jgi:hypothetical protein
LVLVSHPSTPFHFIFSSVLVDRILPHSASSNLVL